MYENSTAPLSDITRRDTIMAGPQMLHQEAQLGVKSGAAHALHREQAYGADPHMLARMFGAHYRDLPPGRRRELFHRVFNSEKRVLGYARDMHSGTASPVSEHSDVYDSEASFHDPESWADGAHLSGQHSPLSWQNISSSPGVSSFYSKGARDTEEEAVQSDHVNYSNMLESSHNSGVPTLTDADGRLLGTAPGAPASNLAKAANSTRKPNESASSGTRLTVESALLNRGRMHQPSTASVAAATGPDGHYCGLSYMQHYLTRVEDRSDGSEEASRDHSRTSKESREMSPPEITPREEFPPTTVVVDREVSSKEHTLTPRQHLYEAQHHMDRGSEQHDGLTDDLSASVLSFPHDFNSAVTTNQDDSNDAINVGDRSNDVNEEDMHSSYASVEESRGLRTLVSSTNTTGAQNNKSEDIDDKESERPVAVHGSEREENHGAGVFSLRTAQSSRKHTPELENESAPEYLNSSSISEYSRVGRDVFNDANDQVAAVGSSGSVSSKFADKNMDEDKMVYPDETVSMAQEFPTSSHTVLREGMSSMAVADDDAAAVQKIGSSDLFSPNDLNVLQQLESVFAKEDAEESDVDLGVYSDRSGISSGASANVARSALDDGDRSGMSGGSSMFRDAFSYPAESREMMKQSGNFLDDEQEDVLANLVEFLDENNKDQGEASGSEERSSVVSAALLSKSSAGANEQSSRSRSGASGASRGAPLRGLSIENENDASEQYTQRSGASARNVVSSPTESRRSGISATSPTARSEIEILDDLLSAIENEEEEALVRILSANSAGEEDHDASQGISSTAGAAAQQPDMLSGTSAVLTEDVLVATEHEHSAITLDGGEFSEARSGATDFFPTDILTTSQQIETDRSGFSGILTGVSGISKQHERQDTLAFSAAQSHINQNLKEKFSNDSLPDSEGITLIGGSAAVTHRELSGLSFAGRGSDGVDSRQNGLSSMSDNTSNERQSQKLAAASNARASEVLKFAGSKPGEQARTSRTDAPELFTSSSSSAKGGTTPNKQPIVWDEFIPLLSVVEQGAPADVNGAPANVDGASDKAEDPESLMQKREDPGTGHEETVSSVEMELPTAVSSRILGAAGGDDDENKLSPSTDRPSEQELGDLDKSSLQPLAGVEAPVLQPVADATSFVPLDSTASNMNIPKKTSFATKDILVQYRISDATLSSASGPRGTNSDLLRSPTMEERITKMMSSSDTVAGTRGASSKMGESSFPLGRGTVEDEYQHLLVPSKSQIGSSTLPVSGDEQNKSSGSQIVLQEQDERDSKKSLKNSPSTLGAAYGVQSSKAMTFAFQRQLTETRSSVQSLAPQRDIEAVDGFFPAETQHATEALTSTLGASTLTGTARSADSAAVNNATKAEVRQAAPSASGTTRPSIAARGQQVSARGQQYSSAMMPVQQASSSTNEGGSEGRFPSQPPSGPPGGGGNSYTGFFGDSSNSANQNTKGKGNRYQGGGAGGGGGPPGGPPGGGGVSSLDHRDTAEILRDNYREDLRRNLRLELLDLEMNCESWDSMLCIRFRHPVNPNQLQKFYFQVPAPHEGESEDQAQEIIRQAQRVSRGENDFLAETYGASRMSVLDRKGVDAGRIRTEQFTEWMRKLALAHALNRMVTPAKLLQTSKEKASLAETSIKNHMFHAVVMTGWMHLRIPIWQSGMKMDTKPRFFILDKERGLTWYTASALIVGRKAPPAVGNINLRINPKSKKAAERAKRLRSAMSSNAKLLSKAVLPNKLGGGSPSILSTLENYQDLEDDDDSPANRRGSATKKYPNGRPTAAQLKARGEFEKDKKKSKYLHVAAHQMGTDGMPISNRKTILDRALKKSRAIGKLAAALRKGGGEGANDINAAGDPDEEGHHGGGGSFASQLQAALKNHRRTVSPANRLYDGDGMDDKKVTTTSILRARCYSEGTTSRRVAEPKKNPSFARSVTILLPEDDNQELLQQGDGTNVMDSRATNSPPSRLDSGAWSFASKNAMNSSSNISVSGQQTSMNKTSIHLRDAPDQSFGVSSGNLRKHLIHQKNSMENVLRPPGSPSGQHSDADNNSNNRSLNVSGSKISWGNSGEGFEKNRDKKSSSSREDIIAKKERKDKKDSSKNKGSSSADDSKDGQLDFDEMLPKWGHIERAVFLKNPNQGAIFYVRVEQTGEVIPGFVLSCTRSQGGFKRWADRLAILFGVPFFFYSEEFTSCKGDIFEQFEDGNLGAKLAPGAVNTRRQDSTSSQQQGGQNDVDEVSNQEIALRISQIGAGGMGRDRMDKKRSNGFTSAARDRIRQQTNVDAGSDERVLTPYYPAPLRQQRLQTEKWQKRGMSVTEQRQVEQFGFENMVEDPQDTVLTQEDKEKLNEQNMKGFCQVRKEKKIRRSVGDKVLVTDPVPHMRPEHAMRAHQYEEEILKTGNLFLRNHTTWAKFAHRYTSRKYFEQRSFVFLRNENNPQHVSQKNTPYQEPPFLPLFLSSYYNYVSKPVINALKPKPNVGDWKSRFTNTNELDVFKPFKPDLIAAGRFPNPRGYAETTPGNTFNEIFYAPYCHVRPYQRTKTSFDYDKVEDYYAKPSYFEELLRWKREETMIKERFAQFAAMWIPRVLSENYTGKFFGNPENHYADTSNCRYFELLRRTFRNRNPNMQLVSYKAERIGPRPKLETINLFDQVARIEVIKVVRPNSVLSRIVSDLKRRYEAGERLFGEEWELEELHKKEYEKLKPISGRQIRFCVHFRHAVQICETFKKELKGPPYFVIQLGNKLVATSTGTYHPQANVFVFHEDVFLDFEPKDSEIRIWMHDSSVLSQDSLFAIDHEAYGLDIARSFQLHQNSTLPEEENLQKERCSLNKKEHLGQSPKLQTEDLLHGFVGGIPIYSRAERKKLAKEAAGSSTSQGNKDKDDAPRAAVYVAVSWLNVDWQRRALEKARFERKQKSRDPNRKMQDTVELSGDEDDSDYVNHLTPRAKLAYDYRKEVPKSAAEALRRGKQMLAKALRAKGTVITQARKTHTPHEIFLALSKAAAPLEAKTLEKKRNALSLDPKAQSNLVKILEISQESKKRGDQDKANLEPPFFEQWVARRDARANILTENELIGLSDDERDNWV